ncbi:hypothetical protein O181_000318 [Austropuccinia psidii MF-1]|uniref:Uncharacterized protein n=1 Tax=Austropuccinia psidii MF-1 TaxID=1389203 RepID=A0A9Q3B8M4_9BASI|nr:hypothetical protein [Austropuccinia psidii MF-1]
MIKVEHPQSQQGSKHQLGFLELRNTKLPSCITRISQGSVYATQNGYPIPKTERSRSRITSREVIEAISKLELKSRLDSLATHYDEMSDVAHTVLH